MWECRKCHERIEDSFEVCWSCGTSIEGVEDPSFCKTFEPDGLDQEIASRFRCAKCRTQGASVTRLAFYQPMASAFAYGDRFLAVSCSCCGFTELYNPDMLERQGTRMELLDLLFGRSTGPASEKCDETDSQ